MRIIVFLIILFVSFSCTDVLDIEDPNRYTEDSYFVDLDRTEESINAIYSALRHDGLFVRMYYFVFDKIGNEADGGFGTSHSEFDDMTFDAASNSVGGYWASLYRIVLRANVAENAIANLGIEDGSDDAVRRDVQLGQAYFFKAWAYFELVTGFGRVPLRKTLADREVLNMPRADETEIWEFIESNLNMAIDLLPMSYAPEDLGRATRIAAQGLLGKSLVYQEKYTEAVSVFDELEGTGLDLVDDHFDNFSNKNENNEESLFEVQFFDRPSGFGWYMFNGPANGGLYEDPSSSGAVHTGRHKEYSWTEWFNCKVPTVVGDQFEYANEEGELIVDPRAFTTFYGREGIGDSIFCDNCSSVDPLLYPRSIAEPDVEVDWREFGYGYKKYCMLEDIPIQGEPRSDVNHRLLRYADILLLDAEAHIFSNNLAEARLLINRVRRRVGVFEYTTLGDQSQAFEILRRERLLELLGEQQRWRDLVRWGIAEEVINSEKSGNIFLSKHNKLPIPTAERQTNAAVRDDISGDWN